MTRSPNYDERNAAINMVVLHYTGMKSAEEAIRRLCDPASKVSAHYVVEESGKVHNLVDEKYRAWHAGISYWRGMRNVNANSVGIEIVNPGHEFGYREFTETQYDSVIDLCAGIKRRYNIEDVNIVGHADIAPDRKEDPGELFDWHLLAENGVGLWPDVKSAEQRTSLLELGYEFHDEFAITAFQRHWRPSKVDGTWDQECAGILAGLLSKTIAF